MTEILLMVLNIKPLSHFFMTEILLKGRKTPNDYDYLISPWLKYCLRDVKHQTIVS